MFVVAFVGSYNDYKKEAQFLKLQAISDKDNIVSSYSYLLGKIAIYLVIINFILNFIFTKHYSLS